ncbi:hypothetical protein NFI96_029910, partial [Prochilodus magdalenae]
IYLFDMTYIDSAYPATDSIIETEQRANQMNNLLRIISDLQVSCNYDYLLTLPHVQKYLMSVRHIEELQKFVEDDNYTCSDLHHKQVFEKLVRDFICSSLPATLDPMQFAYRQNRSTDDAIALTLHTALSHLDKKNTYVRMLFVDYSSAFNTIAPLRLDIKLRDLGLNSSLCSWILNILTDRRQVVKLAGITSSSLTLSTGAPQDDTTIVGLISNNNEEAYREEVSFLTHWCRENNLSLNVNKTKELIVDFRKQERVHTPITINGAAVERVSSFKFLGVHITEELTWTEHTTRVVKKAQQRLFFLRWLIRFGMDPRILRTFYTCTVESILTGSITTWYGSCTAIERKALQRVVRTAQYITGVQLPNLLDLYTSCCLRKTRKILKDSTNPSHCLFSQLPSGRRLSLRIEPGNSSPRLVSSKEDLGGPLEESVSARYNRRPTCPDTSVVAHLPTPPPARHRKSHSLGNNMMCQFGVVESKSATLSAKEKARHLLDDSFLESHSPVRNHTHDSVFTNGISLGGSRDSSFSDEFSSTVESASDPTPQRPQQLQAGGTRITLDEDPGEIASCPPPPTVLSIPCQPMLLKDKLECTGLDHHLTTWTLDYLTNRPQYMWTQDCQSDMVVCSTGAPQGTVLAPLVFTLYTADFKYSSANCHLQKFSADSAIVSLISDGDDREYRELTKDFVEWCQRNCLQINAGKTKELVVDVRRAKHSPQAPVNIQGTDIEIVRSYKYLGVHLNNKLDWTDNTPALYKKGQSRLHLLRRLRSFGVQGAFYEAVVASAIFYGVVCWGSSISTADRKRLNRIKSSSVLGCHLDPVEVVGDRRMRTKFKHMLKNLSLPMYHSVKALGSFSARLLHPRASGAMSSYECSSLSSITIEGALRRKTVMKEGKKPTLSSWKRYWIVLSGSTLIYFDSKALRANERRHYKSRPCKKISLTGWIVVLPDEPQHPNIFQLNDPDKGNVYKFQTGSRFSAIIWHKHLAEACRCIRPQIPANLMSFE